MRNFTLLQEDVDENIGMLRVKIIRGINLAVRDMLTSDPYVILLLGEQVGLQHSFIKIHLKMFRSYHIHLITIQ